MKPGPPQECSTHSLPAGQPADADRPNAGPAWLPLKPWQAYVFAALATVVTLGLRLALDSQLGDEPTLIIFTVPIMLAAYLGGMRAGLLATTLSFFLASYFLLPPIHSFAIAATAQRWNVSFVMLAGVIISVLNEALHRAQRRAGVATEDLRARVALVRTEVLQSAIFNSANFSSIATEANGVIQIFNAGAERMYGYSAAEVSTGMVAADLQDPQDVIARAAALSHEFSMPIAPGFDALVFKASRGLEDVFEATLMRKDGSRFPAMLSVTALRDPHGEIIGYLLIATDRTARKRAEEAQQASDTRYRTLFEYAPDGILIADGESNYIDANASMCRMLGRERDELIGLNASDIVSAPEVAHIGPALSAIKAEAGYHREWQFQRKDGSVFAAEVIATQMPDGKLMAMVHDVTGRKQAEARLHRLVDSNAQGVMFWSAAGAITQANDAFLRIVGHEREDLEAGRVGWATMTPPEYGERDRNALAEIAARGDCTPYEKEFVRKDGSRVSVLVGAANFEDSPDEGVCFVLDISTRKQADLALRESDALLRTMRLHSIVSITDGKGKIVDVNDNFCAISGYSDDELLDRTHRIVNSGVHSAAFWTDMARHVATGKTWRGEICNRTKQGSLYWVDTIIAPFRGEDGRTHKYISIGTDVTERKRYEDTLRESTYKAEQANRAKSEFLANMSHEIRTPMNAVIGLSYLLGQTPLDERQAGFVAKVKLASKSLLVVINNVLDLSKIEAGELIVEHAPFSLGTLLRDLTEVMAIQAYTRGIAFRIDIPNDLPEAFEGDATLINQILTNLLSNAIKFTERGSVELRVRRLAGAGPRVRLSFAVQDTGIGIAPDMQAKLFAPFAQADASITRRFGGTGLGLSIVKRLAGLMDGQVGLESTPGVGSEFKVVLDLALASPEAVAQLQALPVLPGERALLGVRVLVVDDSDINLEVTKRILELEGARVRLAGNGQEALDLLAAEPGAIDIVLMDVQMPVLDGHDATRKIRLELGLADLPIIALTAGALSSERQRAGAAGMDDFIIKPFDAQALVRSILRHVTPVPEKLTRSGDVEQATPAQTARPWPEIEGVDSKDASERLNADFGLFRSMLERLLGEFTDVVVPPAAAGPAALALHAGRMHKLRGSAGMLGAREIQRLAGEAEAAGVAGERERAVALAAALGIRLQALRLSAAPALLAARAEAEAEDVATSSSADLDPQVLLDLLALLRQQSLAATDRFSAVSPQLRRLLSKDAYELVRGHIGNLEFSEAAEALEEGSRG